MIEASKAAMRRPSISNDELADPQNNADPDPNHLLSADLQQDMSVYLAELVGYRPVSVASCNAMEDFA